MVISRDPLVDYVPLYRGNDGQPITAFEMGILEKIGLLKMDFLGLSNLTILARRVENIKQTRGIDARRPASCPLDDPKTYEMLGARRDDRACSSLKAAGMTRYVSS